jgi:hypothetical protein
MKSKFGVPCGVEPVSPRRGEGTMSVSSQVVELASEEEYYLLFWHEVRHLLVKYATYL